LKIKNIAQCGLRKKEDDIMTPNNVNLTVDKVVERTFNYFCQEICSPTYYKNRFLEYAALNNDSVQCICRENARLLYASSTLEGHQSDKYHANSILTFLQNYTNTKTKNFLNSLMHEFLDEVEYYNDFLVLFCKGREKGFRSVTAKILYKLVMTKALKNVITDFQKIGDFKQFSEKETLKANHYLKELLYAIEKKNPLKDFHGFRLIVDKTAKVCSEKERIKYCYTLQAHLIAFLEEKGFEVIEQKDYIQKPKPGKKYQSIHITVLILGVPVEFQIRTKDMHYEAEYGKASHLLYKDSLIQNFLRDFLLDLSKGSKRISNENNGFLDCLTLIDRTISKVSDAEIPRTPEDLQPVDPELLKKLM